MKLHENAESTYTHRVYQGTVHVAQEEVTELDGVQASKEEAPLRLLVRHQSLVNNFE
jgi:hypothetical protein